MRDRTIANTAPTGTKRLTALAKPGCTMKRISMKTMGPTAIFQFLETKTTASPPKRAGRMLANAGASNGDSKMGASVLKSNMPRNKMIVVTIEEIPMDRVEMASPSGVPGSTFATFMALMAQGALRFVMLPVTKLRYDPPAPSIGP